MLALVMAYMRLDAIDKGWHCTAAAPTSWGIPPQIDQAITPYISDFDETLSVGLSWALILAVTFSASSVKWFTRYRPRQLPGADKN